VLQPKIGRFVFSRDVATLSILELSRDGTSGDRWGIFYLKVSVSKHKLRTGLGLASALSRLRPRPRRSERYTMLAQIYSVPWPASGKYWNNGGHNDFTEFHSVINSCHPFITLWNFVKSLSPSLCSNSTKSPRKPFNKYWNVNVGDGTHHWTRKVWRHNIISVFLQLK